jgi:proteasome alpha subunit
MTEEPYRWLEAISNRREYIQEQLKGSTPVFALSRPEGILLLGVGRGQSKVFEIYDRHGFAALGHPVDIERLRQAAIEAAHLEGFNRSGKDVKGSFEQIFSPPFIVESIFAELGTKPEQDVLVRVHYDGNHHYETSGVLVAGTDRKYEEEAAGWLRRHLKAEHSLGHIAGLCLTAWQAMVETKPFAELAATAASPPTIAGRTVEVALLDRALPGPVHYRVLDLS